MRPISNLKLAIGIPCSFPHVPISFVYSLLAMERPDFVLIHADNGGIDALRNDLVQKAQAVKANKLLMIDTDQVYPADTVTKLLDHHLPVVGAVVHRRYPPFDPIMLKKTDMGWEGITKFKYGDLVEVDATGAGCMLFDMSIFQDMDTRAQNEISEFEKLKPSSEELDSMPESTRQYILGLQNRCVHPHEPGVYFKFRKQENGMTMGEDIGFCFDLKQAGYKAYVDTSIDIEHLTTMAVNKNTHRVYNKLKGMKFKNLDRAFGKQLKDKLKQEV